MASVDRRMVDEARLTPPTPTLIRWGAVFGGVVLGFSLLVLLSTLWVAMASGTNAVEAVRTNLRWFIAASAIVAMFVGGLIAGWLSGVPRVSAGTFNGLTVWGLLVVATLGIGVPSALAAIGFDPNAVTPDQATAQVGANADALWATLIALVIGAISAGLGGAAGGAMTTPAGTTEMLGYARERDYDRERDSDRERDRERERPVEHRVVERVVEREPESSREDHIVLPEEVEASSRRRGDTNGR